VTLRIRIYPAARRDLLEQEVYFAAVESEELRERFRTEAFGAFGNLAEFPGLGAERASTHPELSGLRVWPIPHFPKLLIFYREAEGSIEVVRVLHSARDIPKIIRYET
jgi:plasmid stabilization system protein ParE